MSSVDSDKNNKIKYEEFLFLTVEREVFLSIQNIRIAFDYFDNDYDGFVFKDDLLHLKINDWFANTSCDIDRITFDDFMLIMNRHLLFILITTLTFLIINLFGYENYEKNNYFIYIIKYLVLQFKYTQ